MDMYQKRETKTEEKNSNQEEIKLNDINWYIPTLINFLRKPYFTRFHI